VTDSHSTPIVETLRGRILRGIQTGTLQAGERLPSARELVDEFRVDHRFILAAYRELGREGLVEVRERGGIYVARDATLGGLSSLPISWFVDTLTDAFAREIPGPELHEWLRRATETLRLRAIVISSTRDQVVGLARELRDDFGLLAEGMIAEEIASSVETPAALRRADVIVVTEKHIELAQRLGASLGKTVIAIDVRPDLVVGEWALLLRKPVWAIVGSAEFGAMLHRFFENVKGIENLHVLVHGRDDLRTIPEGAPTYVTSHVRELLGDTPIRGHVLPAARTISASSARTIFDFMVRANLGARSVSLLNRAPI
jgi:DNA-binding transcriptional regulator YhcF (GntR family)